MDILSFRPLDFPFAVEDELLFKAALEMGIEARLLRAAFFQVHFDSDKEGGATLVYEGKPFGHPEVLIPRAGVLTEVEQRISLLKQLQMAGIRLVNDFNGICRAKNKLRAQVLLSNAGVPMPKTVVLEDLAHLEAAAAFLGTPKLILKDVSGTFGSGVVLAESLTSARSIIDALWKGEPRPILAQEYIEEAAGADARIFVLGGKVLASMRRQAKAGEFRSNVELGAQAEIHQPTSEEERIALKAVSVLKLEVAGVDIVQSRRGPLVLEVNANPGFKKLSEVSGVDVAQAIVRHAGGL